MKTSYEKKSVNYQQLSPINFLFRTAKIFPKNIAWVYGNKKSNYEELLNRSKKLSNLIPMLGIKRKQVVTVMLPNIPAMIEAHFGIPMSGAILNTLNTRLDNKTIKYILKHSKSKLFIFHEDYKEQILNLKKENNFKIKFIIVKEPKSNTRTSKSIYDYESLMSLSKLSRNINKKYFPDNEWDSISLNYTSGTTGDPKGVLYHHRGAYLMCLNNQMVWDMGRKVIYLFNL